jgi:ketosteroid isomerase-like protein
MSKKTVILLFLLFSAPLVIYLLFPSDKSRIRKLFKEGAAAVEAKKTEDVMSKVSFNYTDEHGLSYLYLQKVFERVFREMDDIKVDYDIRDIEVSGDTATADVDIRVTARRGQETGYVAGDASSPLRIKFFLDKEHLRWLVVKTEGLPKVF